ncbi:uncharacterized protein LOC116010351 [Ipomoea triloba]|uniref:uncharacterized protein LOC116010351 n=1 Tax=Ipomoea triloba TaxID=35885 RepID=UPI00125DEE1D|nr:uncharacterized protein LOC116010351 [Ipomoea triloba]
MPPRRNVPAGSDNNLSAVDRMVQAMERMAELMLAQQGQNQNQRQPRVDYAKAIASRQPPYYTGEEDPEVYDKNKRKVDDGPGKFRPDNKKPDQGRFNPMQGERKGGMNQRRNSTCRRCGRDHLGENCQGEKIRCFKCGFLGHKYYECRTKMDNFRDPSQGNNQKGGFGGNAGQKPVEIRNGGGNAGQKPVEIRNGGGNFQQGNWGRLKLWSTVRLDLNVKTALRIVVTRRESYDNVAIEIAGSGCPENLVRFELEGIDVVRGMDWLDKYKARIACNERKKLRKYAHQGCVVYLCLVQDAEIEEPEINRIPVIREFLTYFPDDLTKMPPEREVEFTTDLVPRNSPISKAPYRMPPREMEGRKAQSAERLEKEFIRPSVSPWGRASTVR